VRPTTLSEISRREIIMARAQREPDLATFYSPEPRAGPTIT